MTGSPSEDFHHQAFEQHHGRILNYAWRLTGCWDEAEDVAAQCFLALARMAATGNRPAQIQPWLYRCAFNTVVSLHRKATVRRMALGELWSMVLHGGTTGPAPQPDETLPEIRKALLRLRATDRQVIVLIYDEELDFATVSSIVGLTESSVRSKLSRALERLRKEMGVQRHD